MSESVQLYQVRGSSASAIAASVEEGVRAGTIPPGAELPSVRGLAGELGVSPGTVVAAMRILTRRGIVVSAERRRSRIAGRPPLAARAASPVADGVRDLATGNPDVALLPDIAGAAASLAGSAGLYGDPPMLPRLAQIAREAFARSDIDAQHVCLVGGALDGIERLLAARLVPGDRVAVEDPGYSALVDLVRALGLDVEPVAIDERGPLPEALAAVLGRIDAIVVTPRGQNPLGAAIDADRAAELRAVLAARPEVLVVEDDHLGAVAGAPHHPIGGAGERWAVVRSVAKALGPDLRLAYMAGDATSISRVAGRQLVGTGWVSHILQGIVVALEDDPAVQRLLERAAVTYAERRGALIDALAARGIASTGRSGLQVWIPVDDESLVVDGLRARGYAVARGDRYRLATPPGIRVTVAALEPADAIAFADDLVATLRLGVPARTG